MSDPRLDDYKRRMDGALEALRKEFTGLRTGRASVNLLDPVQVSAYGSTMPLNQVGTVSVPEPVTRQPSSIFACVHAAWMVVSAVALLP